jgi:carbon-monoxide dehydrogenase medium subunit
MLRNIESIVRPSSVEEALAMLAEGDHVRPIAGGTAVSSFRSSRVTQLVDLWGLPLDGIAVDGGALHIGALATLSRIERGELVRGPVWGVLAEAAGSAASTPLRNLITIGGNLAGLVPWADMPGVLLALDAEVLIAGPAGPSRPIGELLAGRPAQVLGRDSLITGFRIPASPGSGAAFRKFGLSAVDYAWVDVAVFVTLRDGVCETCRFVVSGVEARPRRLEAVEALVQGAVIDEELARRAGRLAAEEVRPRRDPRADAGYRRELTSALGRRMLLEAARRAVEAEKEGGR